MPTPSTSPTSPRHPHTFDTRTPSGRSFEHFNAHVRVCGFNPRTRSSTRVRGAFKGSTYARPRLQHTCVLGSTCARSRVQRTHVQFEGSTHAPSRSAHAPLRSTHAPSSSTHAPLRSRHARSRSMHAPLRSTHVPSCSMHA